MKKLIKKIIDIKKKMIHISKSNVLEDMKKYTNNDKLIDFVVDKVNLCNPDNIHLCDGSEQENKEIYQKMVNEKMAIKLKNKENCYYVRTGKIFHLILVRSKRCCKN
jgi:GTP-dependent phosphoenolpyruvate carboxykinase